MNKREADTAKLAWLKVYNNAEALDPNKELYWESLAIGFFIGMGFNFEDAKTLAQEVPL